MSTCWSQAKKKNLQNIKLYFNSKKKKSVLRHSVKECMDSKGNLHLLSICERVHGVWGWEPTLDLIAISYKLSSTLNETAVQL